MTKRKKLKQSKKKSSSKNIVKHIHKHLMRDVSIPLGLVVVLLMLVLIKVPYQATEVYEETEPYQIEIREVIQDKENGMLVRKCKEVSVRSRIEEDPFSPYIELFGLDTYICKAIVKVYNDEETEGRWTLRYVFNVSGKQVVTESVSKKVSPLSAVKFTFESDECQKEDKLEGYYQILEQPTTQECDYEEIFPNKTITRNETRYRVIKKSRKITKYEPLWQYLIGYNKHEKN